MTTLHPAIPEWARGHLPALHRSTPQPRVLVRWFDEPSADCIRDDGVRDYDVADFASITNVFVTDSVDNAKLLIQQALIKDELLYGDDNEPLTDHDQPWRWEQDKPPLTAWWTLFLRGDVVVSACIEPINVLQPDGGPQ